MAQAGYTPIRLYYSTTASAVPDAANLAAGELALNIADMKLYCENSSGVVTLLASSGGASGDVVGPASATDNAVARFDLTTGKLIQNSVVTIADTTGDIAGAGSITSTSASGILTRAAATQDGVELTGRAGGTNSYKVTFTPTTLSASRTLTLPDASGTILQSGTAVTVAQGGTGSTTLTANNVILGNGTSAVQFVAPGTNGNVLTSNGTTWTSAAGSSLATPLAVVGNNTAGSEIRLPEDTDNGSNYVALKAANSLASNVTFTLPDADGTSGQVIQTNGSGTLSFVSPAGAWVYISTTTASSSATISIEDNFSTYDLYAIQIVNLAAESNVSNFQVELKIDGSYQTASQYGTSQATVANTWASATGNLPILFSNLSGNNLINAWMTLYIPKVNTSTPKKTITAIGGYIYATDSARNIHGSLNYNGGPSSNAISGFRFKFDTGNISTGTFRLYGIKNS